MTFVAKTITNLIVPLLIFGFSLTSVGQNEDVKFDREPLPLVRLLANPERYQGKGIRVSGVLSASYEGTALFMEEGSYKHHVDANAVWLAVPKNSELAKSMERLEGKWVTVIGKFEAEQLGAFGLFSGTIVVASFREITLSR